MPTVTMTTNDPVNGILAARQAIDRVIAKASYDGHVIGDETVDEEAGTVSVVITERPQLADFTAYLEEAATEARLMMPQMPVTDEVTP